MFKSLFNLGKTKEDCAIDQVLNPLNITPSSTVEFKIGELSNGGLCRFRKIVEMEVSERKYVRYLIYSNLKEEEYILEVFPMINGENKEIFLYHLQDTVPFSEEFLNDVAGQRFLQTPDGYEFIRCIMPDNEDRIEGLKCRATVYNIEDNCIERSFVTYIWDYERDKDGGLKEYLNLEMMEQDGMFRVFIGEIIEDTFIKVYNTSK